MRGDPKKIRAQFDTWIVRKPNALVSEIPGKFTVEIRPVYHGKRFFLHVVCQPGMLQFPEFFPESKVSEAMAYAESHFKARVSPWEDMF